MMTPDDPMGEPLNPEGNPKNQPENLPPDLADINKPASSLIGEMSPEDRWRLKVANQTDFLTSTPILERTCSRTGALPAEIVKSDRGVELIRTDIPKAIICFMDKDNVGVLADVGLNKLADFLFEQEGKVFKQTFGPKDKFVRYAGDEFIYITNDSKSGERKIQAALHLLGQIRSKDSLFEIAPMHSFFGAKDITDLQQRLDRAELLARVSKSMSSIMGLFQQDLGSNCSSASFGDWLFQSTDADMRAGWLSQRGITCPISSFASAANKFECSVNETAHAFQAFVAKSLVEDLAHGRSIKRDGLDARISEVVQLTYDRAEIFGVSYSKVKLPDDYSSLDIKQAIVKAEKHIHAAKIAKTTDLDSVKEIDPQNKLRDIDDRDLQKTNQMVNNFYEIKERLAKNLLNAADRLDLQKEAFDILYGDPSSSDCFRVNRVGDIRTGILMDIADSADCTAIRFSIDGFGTFNKYMRMDLADELFKEMMSVFENEVRSLQGAKESPVVLIKFREGGGKGAILFKGNDRPQTFEQDMISQKMEDRLKTKIDRFMEMPLHEKRAFKSIMGLDSSIDKNTNGDQTAWGVKVMSATEVASCNVRFGDFYNEICNRYR